MATMRLSDAVEGFLMFKAVDCSKHTLKDYDNTFRQWLTFLEDDPPVDEVTAAHVQRFLYYLRVDRELKPKTVKNALTGISSFFSWAEVELQVAHVVRGRVQLPNAPAPEIIPLTQKETKDLIRACARSASWQSARRTTTEAKRPTRWRDRAIILTLLDTGARAQELCDLKVGDVNLETGMAVIRKGKRNKERIVYLGKITRESLWRYLAKREFKDKTDPLFMTSKRGPLDRHALRKMLARAGDRAEISEPVYPHRLRHTFAINYLRNGGDIYTLQRLLGHSSLDMVRRYLSIAEVDLEQTHRRASPVDNWRL